MTTTTPSDIDLLQRFANRRLNRQEPLQCNTCGRRLHEQDGVVVRLHLDWSDRRWLTTGRFCAGCGPKATQGPKPFAAEVVVRGRVGSVSDAQSEERFPVLLTPELVDRT